MNKVMSKELKELFKAMKAPNPTQEQVELMCQHGTQNCHVCNSVTCGDNPRYTPHD